MVRLKELLQAEYDRLKEIVTKCEKQIDYNTEGTLRVVKRGEYVQFYHCTKHDDQGRYIPKENEKLIHILAQNEYCRKVIRKAEKTLRRLNAILRDYEDNEVEQLFDRLHPKKQKFITPVEPTWKQRLEEWKNTPYIGKGFQEGSPVIITERGERVRSKSEKILADYFYHHGIEYKYECPLILKKGGVIYPDFTFLSPKTGEEIYWEHMGMMHDPVYAKAAVKKIYSYEDNNIYQGEKLILTYETDQMVLSKSEIERIVKKYLV